MNGLTQLLRPDWPAPATVHACVTTREGGVSLPPYESFNLGDHVGDDPAAVAENRRRLSDQFAIQPAWLKQVHGLLVADADPAIVAEADASWTDQAGIACTVMTAGSLLAWSCDRAGTRVAAAHAGWGGLAGGVLEATLDRLQVPADQVLVWLGPAIGPQAFEVGLEVRDAFTAVHPEAARAFVPGERTGKLMADIYELARIRLAARGVTAVYGGGFCTVSDPRFFSYRRTPQGGRFASLVWLAGATS